MSTVNGAGAVLRRTVPSLISCITPRQSSTT